MKRNTLVNLLSVILTVVVLVAMGYIWSAHLLPKRADSVRAYTDGLQSDGAVLLYTVSDGKCTVVAYTKNSSEYFGVLIENNDAWVIVPRSEIHAKTETKTARYTLKSINLSGSNYKVYLAISADAQPAEMYDSVSSSVYQTNASGKIVTAILINDQEEGYILTVNGKDYEWD